MLQKGVGQNVHVTREMAIMHEYKKKKTPLQNMHTSQAINTGQNLSNILQASSAILNASSWLIETMEAGRVFEFQLAWGTNELGNWLDFQKGTPTLY